MFSQHSSTSENVSSIIILLQDASDQPISCSTLQCIYITELFISLTFHPANTHNLNLLNKGGKKTLWDPPPFASRVLSPNAKHSRAAWALSQRELHSPRLECTRPACLGPRWRDHPGSVSLKHGSESGAQQSNDTLVELLDHRHQIPKKKEMRWEDDGESQGGVTQDNAEEESICFISICLNVNCENHPFSRISIIESGIYIYWKLCYCNHFHESVLPDGSVLQVSIQILPYLIVGLVLDQYTCSGTDTWVSVLLPTFSSCAPFHQITNTLQCKHCSFLVLHCTLCSTPCCALLSTCHVTRRRREQQSERLMFGWWLMQSSITAETKRRAVWSYFILYVLGVHKLY